MCEYSEEDTVITLPCDKRHYFHDACIKEWLERNNACPLCKKPITEADLNCAAATGATIIGFDIPCPSVLEPRVADAGVLVRLSGTAGKGAPVGTLRVEARDGQIVLTQGGEARQVGVARLGDVVEFVSWDEKPVKNDLADMLGCPAGTVKGALLNLFKISTHCCWLLLAAQQHLIAHDQCFYRFGVLLA